MTSGILLLDKPQGLSSNAALQRVRHALGRIKGGHTGSLDPLATGMLPLCLGEATKVAGDLLEGRKSYLFTARLGTRRSTGDLEGEVVETLPVPDDAEIRLAAIAARILGPIQQVPPMYSALKRDGQPLYKLARQGIEVERAARTVEILKLELLQVQDADFSWRVVCSKGTYVRTLAEDLAREIGTCAHLTHLRREHVEPFEAFPMVTLDQVLADPRSVTLLPADAALLQFASLHVDADAVRKLFLGQQVVVGSPALPGRLKLYDPDGRFFGLGEMVAEDLLQPRRLFNDIRADLLERGGVCG